MINVHSDDLLFHSENRHEGRGNLKRESEVMQNAVLMAVP